MNIQWFQDYWEENHQLPNKEGDEANIRSHGDVTVTVVIEGQHGATGQLADRERVQQHRVEEGVPHLSSQHSKCLCHVTTRSRCKLSRRSTGSKAHNSNNKPDHFSSLKTLGVPH